MNKKYVAVILCLILIIALLTPAIGLARPPDPTSASGSWYQCFTTGGNLWTALDCLRWAAAHTIYEIQIVAW